MSTQIRYNLYPIIISIAVFLHHRISRFQILYQARSSLDWRVWSMEYSSHLSGTMSWQARHVKGATARFFQVAALLSRNVQPAVYIQA